MKLSDTLWLGVGAISVCLVIRLVIKSRKEEKEIFKKSDKLLKKSKEAIKEAEELLNTPMLSEDTIEFLKQTMDEINIMLNET